MNTGILVTKNAWTKMAAILKHTKNNNGFIYSASSGGCNGFNFVLELLNEVVYNNHQILQDYNIYKFGFEYITQEGTPIRGGLFYRTANLRAISPVSMFTFGTGKKIGNLIIDVAGTYCFYSFNYPDLFPVEGDNRPDYDLVRESQLQLQLALIYRF